MCIMNAAGIGFGAASLPGAFLATVDCFHYVQFARSFGADFNKCLLKLEISRWRLTQWGASVGLTPDAVKNGTIENKLPEGAAEILGQIQAEFDRAEKLSSKYQGNVRGSQSSTSVSVDLFDAYTDLGAVEKRVYSTVRAQAEQRQKSVGILGKTKWALSRRYQFDRLIGCIQEFISALIDLVPAAQDHQEAICKVDLNSLLDESCLNTIRDFSSEDDKILKEAIAAQGKYARPCYEDFEMLREKDACFGNRNDGYESAGKEIYSNYRRFKMTDGQNNVFGTHSIRHGNS